MEPASAGEKTYYRKRRTFFLAKLIEKVGAGEPDHRLHWRSAARAAIEFFQESQHGAVAWVQCSALVS